MEEVKYTANEGLFMHIWINLLDNAIKFSPSKGTITMFLKQEQDSVKFILEDEGPGIEDDVKSRIFDKFYQVDGSHKAKEMALIQQDFANCVTTGDMVKICHERWWRRSYITKLVDKAKDGGRF